jgi:hypothetical protein
MVLITRHALPSQLHCHICGAAAQTQHQASTTQVKLSSKNKYEKTILNFNGQD